VIKMSWAEDAGFEANPYQKLDPFKIDPSKLTWNRNDLQEEKQKIDDFVSDLIAGARVGMRVIGAIGSGKTWLARIVEIMLKQRTNSAFVVYTKVPKIEPIFSNVYIIAIKGFLDQFNLIKEKIIQQGRQTDLTAWSSIFKDEDLAKGLSHICSGGKNGLIAKRWIQGDRVTTSELTALDIIEPITSDYKRFEVLVEIFKELSTIFSFSLLIVDELENAPLKLANGLSDGLRDMLSMFERKFGLICLFTAQSFDEWYDAGYSETLTRRIDYHIRVSEIQQAAIHELIRAHHRLYRRRYARIGGNELYPFTSEAIDKIFEYTPLGMRYPGYIFPNMEAIVKLALKREIALPIPGNYVINNISLLPYGTTEII